MEIYRERTEINYVNIGQFVDGQETAANQKAQRTHRQTAERLAERQTNRLQIVSRQQTEDGKHTDSRESADKQTENRQKTQFSDIEYTRQTQRESKYSSGGWRKKYSGGGEPLSNL